MALMHAVLLLLLFCFAHSHQNRKGAGYDLFVQDPELEWERMETVIGDKMPRVPSLESKFLRSASSSGSSTPAARAVPEYVIVSASKSQKEVFKPERGARPLPNIVKEMLLAATARPSVPGSKTAGKEYFEILCHVDRMYVRIRREFFKTREAYKYLKLGTCPVNQGTKEHYYLLHLLKSECGFKKESNVDDVVIRNVLHYKPSGPVLREMAFDIPLQCKYPRFFHSFKAGFHPKLRGGTVFKALQPKSSFTLTSQDVSGNEITGNKSYTLGQPMYFEARRPDGAAASADQRIYINKCYMTAFQDSSSNPKYMVIDNNGCMIDGKVVEESKFLTGDSKMIQKFSVASLIFKDVVSSSSSSQQLYMHCEIFVGKLAPTRTSKACNYDPETKMWKEQYGDDSVCTCCDSRCSSAQPKASSRITSSHSWKVDLSRQDLYVEAEPRMTSSNADSFGLEEPNLDVDSDFLNNWEHDY